MKKVTTVPRSTQLSHGSKPFDQGRVGRVKSEADAAQQSTYNAECHAVRFLSHALDVAVSSDRERVARTHDTVRWRTVSFAGVSMIPRGMHETEVLVMPTHLFQLPWRLRFTCTACISEEAGVSSSYAEYTAYAFTRGV